MSTKKIGPLSLRLAPHIVGLLAAYLMIWRAGNIWVERITPALACMMFVLAIAGAILTRKDQTDNAWLWFVEAVPGIAVVEYATRVGHGDHIGNMSLWLVLIIVSPFLGCLLRHILQSRSTPPE